MGRLTFVLIRDAGIPALVGSIVLSLVCYCMCKICKHSLEEREPPPPDPALIVLIQQAEARRAQDEAHQRQENTSLTQPPQTTQPGVPSSSANWANPPPYPPDEAWIVPPTGPPSPGPAYFPASTAPATKPQNMSILDVDPFSDPIPLSWPDQGRSTSSGSANVQTPINFSQGNFPKP